MACRAVPKTVTGNTAAGSTPATSAKFENVPPSLNRQKHPAQNRDGVGSNPTGGTNARVGELVYPVGRGPTVSGFESPRAHQFKGSVVQYGAGAACKAVVSAQTVRFCPLSPCASGQIGKGATFRPWRFCGFKSHLAHHLPSLNLGDQAVDET